MNFTVSPTEAFQVFIDFSAGMYRVSVGRLASSPADGKIYFQAFESFAGLGFDLSPFQPDARATRLQCVGPKHEELFFGLHGAFGDSLPDGWGGC